MVLPYDFGISIDEYAECGKKNDFPEIDQCPCCKGRTRLARHGFYWRNAITAANQYRLPICRLKCPSCKKTVSLLPSFLLPYFQHTIDVILEKLHNNLIYRKITGYHQLVLFYRKRFIQNLNRIEMFFRDSGFRGVLPQALKEKAIRLLEMLQALGKATLPGRANGHFASNFMANYLNGQVANQKEYLAEIAGKVHQVPHYGPKEFTPKTLAGWLLAYRRAGFEGLKPRQRSDRGQSRKLGQEQEEHLLALRQELRDMPVSVFYDRLVDKGEFLPKDISYATVYRILKKHGMIGKESVRSPERKRFAYDTVNTLWQGDMSVGPYLVLNGRKTKTFLFAFIDDCSRLVPFAQFFFSEKFDSLRTVFKEALIRRGVPRIVYVDNGKIYRSDTFQIACASLGIALTHTQPYDAASKGKIERFFGTVKTRFLPLLKSQPANSLDELNHRFWQWLEEDYHRKIHASLGMSPLDMYLSQASRVRMVEDPASLDPLFLKREKRKVKHDGTISVNNKLYEVPPRFIGQRIEIRFDEDGVYVYEDGQAVAKAVPVNFADNARVKRDRALSFHEMLSGKEG